MASEGSEIVNEIKARAWKSPIGVLPTEIEGKDVPLEARRYVNWYVAKGEGTIEPPLNDFMITRYSTYRYVSMVYLIHASLKDKYLTNVKAERTKKSTAWKILPGGNETIMVIEGKYQSQGKWATEYYGTYVAQVFENPAYKVLEYKHVYSSGGGQGGSLLVVAVDVTKLSAPAPLARVPIRLTPIQNAFMVLWSNGLLTDDILPS